MSHWTHERPFGNRSSDIPDYDRGDVIAMPLGRIEGHTRVLLIGNCLIGAVVPITVWPLATAYPFLAAPAALEVVSTSAADTLLGTGARQVTLELLDASYVRSEVTVTLDGLTPVAVPGLWLRINSALTVSAGTGQANAGTVDVRVAPAGAVLARMPIGANRLRQMVYTVPAAHTAINFSISATIEAPAAANATIIPHLTVGGLTRTGAPLVVIGQGPHVTLEPSLPSVAPERTDLTLRVIADTGTGQVVWAWLDLLVIRLDQVRS